MKPLAADVLEAQKDPNQAIHFYPERFNKVSERWLENIEEFKVFRSWELGQQVYLDADKKKFEDYDSRYSHIMTNKLCGRELYYPKNFTIGKIAGENWWETHNAYIVHGLIGVTGYTMVKAKIN